jgi:hypothetical protein
MYLCLRKRAMSEVAEITEKGEGAGILRIEAVKKS